MKERNHSAAIILPLAIIILASGSLVHYRFGYFLYDQSGHAWGPDDAYISYRYAQNLSTGNGIVFNPGERVEGYSNFLIVILTSCFITFGISSENIYPALTIFNLIIAISTLFVFHSFLVGQFKNGKAYLGTLLFSLSPLLWIWVSAGMEVILVLLFQLLIWVAVTHLEKNNSTSYTLLWISASVLLCLSRTDGFIFPLYSVLYLIIKRRSRITLPLITALLFTLIIIAFWRYSYYGQFLPNTYYAKVSGNLSDRVVFATALLAYIAVNQGFLGYFATIAQSLLNSIREVVNKHRPIIQTFRFEIFGSVAWLAYWFFIGGATYLERFLMILIPFSIFALLTIANRASKVQGWIIVCIFAFCQSTVIFIDPRFDYTWNKYDRWITLGKYLYTYHQGETIAADAVGKISFYSSLYTIDMLGLNDRYIANTEANYFSPGHNKFDQDYILNRKPDLISTWIVPCSEPGCTRIDLSYGLSQEVYQTAGYSLKYLLYTGRTPLSKFTITDVSEYDSKSVWTLINQGFTYGVLSSSEQASAPP